MPTHDDDIRQILRRANFKERVVLMTFMMTGLMASKHTRADERAVIDLLLGLMKEPQKAMIATVFQQAIETGQLADVINDVINRGLKP